MRKLFRAAAVAALSVSLLTSCTLTLPVAATSNTVGAKVGNASTTSFLGLNFAGDASIQTAAKKGGISKISTVDFKTTNVLFILTTYTTIVTGE